VHRSDGEVVDVRVGVGGVGLVRRVGGASDDAIRPDGRPCIGGRRVVLADVHAVGAARRDEVRPVVEQEQRAVLVGRGAELARGLDEAVVAEGLVAQLDEIDAAAQRRAQPLARPRVADQIQPGGREALARAHLAASI
jgi:hypothetical protein